MSIPDSQVLSSEQVEHFLQSGHVVIPDCFSREFAESWTINAFRRLEYDPHDSTTWEKEIIHMPAVQRLPMQDIAPKAWLAACELLGGEERVAPCTWGDGMIINFHKGADQPWQPLSPQIKGWHKDGDLFRHFLDSPEQGLLTIVIWSDIEPQGGGKFAAGDSVAPVARLLTAHPEGILPTGSPEASFSSLIHQCHDFIELTGRVGDVVLIHPFVLHASSQNHSGKARFITNPPISLREPMQFNRDAPADFSAVEQAILRGLPSGASITFALTDKGPLAWAHYHGRPNGEGALPQLAPRITRDEAAKTTTYDLTLPWAEFQSAPGIFPQLGLAVQVNDSQPNVAQQTRLYWGFGAGGNLRPGLFNRLLVGPPPVLENVVSALATRQILWRDGGAAEIMFAISGPQIVSALQGGSSQQPAVSLPDSLREAAIVAQIGDDKQAGHSVFTKRLALPSVLFDLNADRAGAKQDLLRFIVRLQPGTRDKDAVREQAALPFSAWLVSPTGKTLAEASGTIQRPSEVFQALSRRVDDLIAKGPQHPIYSRMLRSVDAVVQAQHLVAVPYLDEQPDLAADTIRYAQIILQGLRGAASDWSEYENGQRLITLAFRARDGSLQPYQVRLPERWESTKDYPLIIDLHGAGNPDTLGFVAQGFGAERAPARDAGAADKEAIVLLPWGRGNLGYQGFAGQDVWSAIDDAARWLRIDPERLYLSGHSMGGSAAWAFALRTPDRWAAVAIYAGRTWMVPSGIGLGANAANLPIRIQHGDQDGAVPVSEAYAMQKELQVGGGNPVLSIERGGGHETSAAAIKATNTWLLTHKRRRPDRFTFIADTDDHTSAWGVELERDPKVSFVPRVECRIQGNVVTLTSSGTPLLRIYPGAQGLGLTGEVTIVWNNKTVYSGAASMVTIDTTTGTATAQ